MTNEKIQHILECVFMEESRDAASGRPFADLACWDSLCDVQLVVAIQSTFGVELNSEQIMRITSVAGLHEVLEEHDIKF